MAIVEQSLGRVDDDIAEEEEEEANEGGGGEVDRFRVLAAAGVAVGVAMVVAVGCSRAPHRAEGS